MLSSRRYRCFARRIPRHTGVGSGLALAPLQKLILTNFKLVVLKLGGNSKEGTYTKIILPLALALFLYRHMSVQYALTRVRRIL